jgi:hypothetical protein
MANRVLPEDVRAIIVTDLDDAALDVFIGTANTLINSTILDKGLPANLLIEIERYLAAHFVAMRERQESEIDVGDGSAKYGGKFGYGLDFTQYGQQVKLLDFTGTLVTLGKPEAEFEILEVAVD